MTYSHSRVSSFSSVSASPSTLLTSSPSLVPAAAPLLQPSFSTASEVDILVDMSQQDKLNLFSLTISSPPPMLMMNNSNDPENIPPLSIADDEEEAFQIHLQHEMQKGSTVSSTSCSSCFSRLCTSHSSLRIQFFSLFFCLLFFLFSLFLVFLSSSNRCTMDTNLRRMFLDVTDALKAHNIEYFLDSGTLLGAVRDGKIIPWEFDLDLGMVESECEKLPRLKEYFSARGYELFVRNDFIPYKENKLMGYDGYLHAPCGRLYDQQAEYYTDIYWFQIVNKERRQRIQHNQHQKAMGLPLVLSDSPLASPLSKNPPRGHGPSYDSFDIDSYITTPWNYSPSLNGDEDWICSAEGFDPTGMPGGCNLKSDILPNRKMSFLGGTHGIPNKPESVLKGVYGDWQTPSAKGYKALFCSALPPMWVSATFAIATGVLATACIMQLYCLVVCGRRELWSTLLKEMKRRLDEYYA